MQNDPAVVQARIDKLLARISTLETANKELQESLSGQGERMREKEKELKEAQAGNGHLADQAKTMMAAIKVLDAEIEGLHAHMDELRQILLKDNDAKTVLDALRLLCKVVKK